MWILFSFSFHLFNVIIALKFNVTHIKLKTLTKFVSKMKNQYNYFTKGIKNLNDQNNEFHILYDVAGKYLS